MHFTFCLLFTVGVYHDQSTPSYKRYGINVEFLLFHIIMDVLDKLLKIACENLFSKKLINILLCLTKYHIILDVSKSRRTRISKQTLMLM